MDISNIHHYPYRQFYFSQSYSIALSQPITLHKLLAQNQMVERFSRSYSAHSVKDFGQFSYHSWKIAKITSEKAKIKARFASAGLIAPEWPIFMIHKICLFWIRSALELPPRACNELFFWIMVYLCTPSLPIEISVICQTNKSKRTFLKESLKLLALLATGYELNSLRKYLARQQDCLLCSCAICPHYWPSFGQNLEKISSFAWSKG